MFFFVRWAMAQVTKIVRKQFIVGFKFRSQAIENKFGTGTSNPAVFGQLLLEFKAENPETNVNILQDMRLLPSYAKFKTQLDAWAAAALEELSADAGSS